MALQLGEAHDVAVCRLSVSVQPPCIRGCCAALLTPSALWMPVPIDAHRIHAILTILVIANTVDADLNVPNNYSDQY